MIQKIFVTHTGDMPSLTGILVDVSDPNWKTLSGKREPEGGSWTRFLLRVVNELIHFNVPFSKETFVLAFGEHFDPEVVDLCSLVKAKEEQFYIENLTSRKTKEEIIHEVLDILESHGARTVRTLVQNTEVAEFLDTTSAAAILYHLQRSPNFAKRFVDECLPRQWDNWKLCLLIPAFLVASSIPLGTALLTVAAVAVVSLEANNMQPKNGIRAAMKNGRLLVSETRTAQRTAVSKDAVFSAQSASLVLQTSIENQVTVEHFGDLLKTIEPCVDRPTPFIQAMGHSLDIFSDPQFEWHERVLFVLSDSQRADESYPHQKLIDLGVTIINCFVTDQGLPDSHQLSGIAHQRWDPSEFTFRVSSITSTPKIPRLLLQSMRWDITNANIKTWNFHEGMFIRILWYVSFGRSKVL